jgi:hypothetical protein
MSVKLYDLVEADPPRCIQDRGFLHAPHAVCAAKLFLDSADRTAAAVESVRRAAGSPRKKIKAGCLSNPGSSREAYRQ